MSQEYPPQQPYQGQPGYPPQQPGYASAPPPPGYGQPGYPPQQQFATGSAAGAKWGPTSMGLEAHILAGLSYLFVPVLGLIFFFMEKNNRFVRFHAAQSIAVGVVGIAIVFINIVLGIIEVAVSSASSTAGAGFGLIGLLFGCVSFLLYLGLFGLVIWGLIAGFTGRYVKFPIIGNFAERMAGGPPVPAY